jgi:hypothetical protein
MRCSVHKVEAGGQVYEQKKSQEEKGEPSIIGARSFIGQRLTHVEAKMARTRRKSGSRLGVASDKSRDDSTANNSELRDEMREGC